MIILTGIIFANSSTKKAVSLLRELLFISLKKIVV